MPYLNKDFQRQYNKEWRIKNRERDLKRQRDRQRQQRLDIIRYYSDGEMVCSCCGESIIEFLSIDHINGGGNSHRKMSKTKSTYHILEREKREKGQYPEGYRVLCHNCNQAYGSYGYCPHKRV
jgi:hypothetical protein